ncbi:APC family permease [Saccharopolyspora rectivirgula]|jgi:APA family basic amino acid/polyamine antiporter|uniref:Amino acid permease n=1 Tax=Saccharopolyspora rectivirgula TaxID=28042 RepID=A0A073B2H0_9PSEU|nr:APC family permease [Saccharopolyspora rectivirgula]KEI45482.1 amino acid permease [Saccharopolyspora rectivirgula]
MANETTVDDDVAERAEAPGLKRVMGPKLLLFFVVGDILGTTIYSLTGKVAGKVGGALWIPFLVAFVVAFLTAVSYLELVGKYPKAGGAPLYVHRAFGVHFVTFLIAFTVMCSGLTSAASAAQAFSGDYLAAIVGDIPSWPVAIAFVLLLAAVNLRGVAESVKMNVVLTCIELLGLVIVIVLGVWAIFGGNTDPELAPDPSRLTEFNTDTTPLLAVTSATALAFFAMVGFEDSVNMAEETKNPAKNFPRALLLGLTITATIYLVIALITSTLVPTGKLAESDGPLLLVVQAAAPWFPPVLFSAIALFAVTNTALINMLMASRLVYGMGQEKIIPGLFAKVHPKRQTPWVSVLFTAAIGVVLVATLDISALGSTTSLLLLLVFAVVNISVLALRREKVEHEHFKAPTWVPVLGALSCLFFASPLSGRPLEEYLIAAVLLGIGVLFWVINRVFLGGRQEFDVEKLTK